MQPSSKTDADVTILVAAVVVPHAPRQRRAQVHLAVPGYPNVILNARTAFDIYAVSRCGLGVVAHCMMHRDTGYLIRRAYPPGDRLCGMLQASCPAGRQGAGRRVWSVPPRPITLLKGRRRSRGQRPLSPRPPDTTQELPVREVQGHPAIGHIVSWHLAPFRLGARPSTTGFQGRHSDSHGPAHAQRPPHLDGGRALWD